MLGAIIGDIIGSTYEFNPIKSKEFELFSPGSRPTDDTVMTVAVGLVTAASVCPDEERYGKRFIRWLNEGNGAAYHSYGNGSAMRVSPVGWRARTLAEAEQLARWSAEVTHDHPDGIRGAQAVASAIFLARTTHDKKRIRGHIASYYYPMEFRLDRIRASYRFDATCPGSVPQAIVCFLESTGYEDAVRNAVSLGGDADTQACIAGAIAEAYYGIPADIQRQGLSYLDSRLSRLFLAYATRLYPQKSG